MAGSYIEDVHAVTRLIPPGRVTTYGAIAGFLTLGSARMVGWALNQGLATGENVPAHRVVNRRGELSGRNNFSTPHAMQRALEAEGIEVENDRITNFDGLFWSPEELLNR